MSQNGIKLTKIFITKLTKYAKRLMCAELRFIAVAVAQSKEAPYDLWIRVA